MQRLIRGGGKVNLPSLILAIKTSKILHRMLQANPSHLA